MKLFFLMRDGGYVSRLLIIASICIFLVVGAIVSQPYLVSAILAKYKSTDHFIVMDSNDRILYEPAAETSAKKASEIIGWIENEVETTLDAEFGRKLQFYICATQKQFNEYVYLSKNARGAVYWEKMFLSPRAFEPGHLKRIALHEATHFLFITHISDSQHVRNVPLWFREGTAEYVANGASEYIARSRYIHRISEREKTAYSSGAYNSWLSTSDPSSVLTKSGTISYDLYRIAGFMVHYMASLDSQKLNYLVGSLLDGETFDQALTSSYEISVEELMSGFGSYLQES